MFCCWPIRHFSMHIFRWWIFLYNSTKVEFVALKWRRCVTQTNPWNLQNDSQTAQTAPVHTGGDKSQSLVVVYMYLSRAFTWPQSTCFQLYSCLQMKHKHMCWFVVTVPSKGNPQTVYKRWMQPLSCHILVNEFAFLSHELNVLSVILVFWNWWWVRSWFD